jgi:wyosine [tRNA(Phe)-imidazoG37] synthetase (radical SAM superfamily)
MASDWVSLKVDAVEEQMWRRIDRPRGDLRLASLLEGVRAFSSRYHGRLATETMIVKGINDGVAHLEAIADYLSQIQPGIAYLSVPTRPPAEEWAQPPNEETLHRAYRIFRERMECVEYLIGYEGNAFAYTGDVEQDLLSITAVHPMREDAVSDYLARAGAAWSVVHRLVAEEQLVELKHGSHKFYLRRLRAPAGDESC